MRKDLVVLIYKGISEQAGVKIEEDQNNDYPAKRTLKDKDPLKMMS